MNLDELEELHYIMPLANLESILTRGILSHKLAAKIDHVSVALEEVQERRSTKIVPRGQRLHEYVNLYVCARNPMMFKRHDDHAKLGVICIDTSVIYITGAVATDMNAAKDLARFRPAPEGIKTLDRAMVFADDWRHPGDYSAYLRHRGIKCCEVLIPSLVPAKYITRIYVSCEESEVAAKIARGHIPVVINQHIFFQ
jgi:hypothetical protein